MWGGKSGKFTPFSQILPFRLPTRYKTVIKTYTNVKNKMIFPKSVWTLLRRAASLSEPFLCRSRFFLTKVYFFLFTMLLQIQFMPSCRDDKENFRTAERRVDNMGKCKGVKEVAG